MNQRIAFIGGGNMANAILGGLIKQGLSAQHIDVVEPFEATREQLAKAYGVNTHPAAGEFLQAAGTVVWAVKPQIFKEATLPVAAHTRGALHLSVAAGIPTDSLRRWLGVQRIVRSMPNTPALIGMGMTGLYATEGVSPEDKSHVERIAGVMGEFVWVEREELLDAVTALSGSGPAYVFYLLEAMSQAGVEMGLSQDQAYRLSLETFRGASALARGSDVGPQVLRERVTSKGGTTYAALTRMNEEQISARFIQALHAAEQRSRELGAEFGKD